ncbi:hypothetical protein Esti_000898 [Eimeria stiedai]
MVRPSPKRYRKFKTAGSRAHAKRLAELARAQYKGTIEVLMWRQDEDLKIPRAQLQDEAKAVEHEIHELPPVQRHQDGDSHSARESAATEGPSSRVPRKLSLKSQAKYLPTFPKFDVKVTEWTQTMPRSSLEFLLLHRGVFLDNLSPRLPARRCVDHTVLTASTRSGWRQKIGTGPPSGAISNTSSSSKTLEQHVEDVALILDLRRLKMLPKISKYKFANQRAIPWIRKGREIHTGGTAA